MLKHWLETYGVIIFQQCVGVACLDYGVQAYSAASSSEPLKAEAE